MIYLASPYSDPSQYVMDKRFREICRISNKLIRDGFTVLSPIAHSHPIVNEGRIDSKLKRVRILGLITILVQDTTKENINDDLSGDFETWKEFDLLMLKKCSALVIALMDGWAASKGFVEEIKFAVANDIPIFLLTDLEKDGINLLRVNF